MYYTQSRSLNLDFNSPDDVGKYGITLVNNAYIDKQGLHTDYSDASRATRPLINEFNSDKLVISIKFSGLDIDSGTGMYFFDTDAVARFYLYRESSGQLAFGANGTGIGSVLKPDYEDYWNAEGENELLCVWKSGDNKIFLNGTLIYEGTAVWTRGNPTELFIGSRNSFVYVPTMAFKEIKVYKEWWSPEDVAAYSNNSLLSFKNQAITWLDFRSERLDGSDRYLNDESGHGNNYVMTGDPEYQNPVGYKLDTNDHFDNTNPSAAYTDLTEYSIAIQTKPDFPLNELVNNHLWGEDGTTSSIYRSSSAARLRFHFIATVIAFWTPAELAGIWNDKSTNIIVCSYKSGKNNIIINGHHKLVDGTVTFATPFTMTNLSLCAQAATGLYSWDGITYHMSDYPFALSPLQMQQLTSDLLTNTH